MWTLVLNSLRKETITKRTKSTTSLPEKEAEITEELHLHQGISHKDIEVAAPDSRAKGQL